MEGILFVPIPAETVSFDVILEKSAMESENIPSFRHCFLPMVGQLITDNDFLTGHRPSSS